MTVQVQLLSLAALVSLASSHAVILNAQGMPNSPASFGFQMVKSIPRNCTLINPCQQDATLIRDAEIAANVVNECGRTELQGNIDVGENTENALAAGQVTQVQSSSQLTITMHQVNADGAGPFNCDLDPTSNGLALTGQIPLNMTSENIPGNNGLSQAKEQDFNFTVQMPPNLKCIGGSTGNICTVRCRNNAQAGPFGGCVAVQQVDTTPNANTQQNIAALKTLPDVLSQIAQNNQDFPAAVQAVQSSGSDPSLQAVAAVNAITGGLPNVNPVIAPPQKVTPQPPLPQAQPEPPQQGQPQTQQQGQQPQQQGQQPQQQGQQPQQQGKQPQQQGQQPQQQGQQPQQQGQQPQQQGQQPQQQGQQPQQQGQQPQQQGQQPQQQGQQPQQQGQQPQQQGKQPQQQGQQTQGQGKPQTQQPGEQTQQQGKPQTQQQGQQQGQQTQQQTQSQKGAREARRSPRN